MSVNVGKCRYFERSGALQSGTEEVGAELSFEGSSLPERLLIEQVLSC